MEQELIKDTRLITLSSKDAEILNGDYKSNCFFHIKNIVEPNPDINFLDVGLIDAQIPVSWFLINDQSNKLEYIYNLQTLSITLTNGNYNANTLASEIKEKLFNNNPSLNATIVLSQVTGLYTFTFINPLSQVTFKFNESKGLAEILGFTQDITSVNNNFTFPIPLNLLGIQKINVCSNKLSSISSYSSQRRIGSNILQTIPVNVPSWNLINYENKNNIHARMKSRHLDSGIDIQLLDENGQFIEFNNIDWNLTIQIIIYRKTNVRLSQIPQFRQMFNMDKKVLEKPKEKPSKENPKEKKLKKDLLELKLLEN